MAAFSGDEARWNTNEDIVKDLARLDDFGTDYEQFTECLTNKGRGTRRKEKSPKPGPCFIDPRTGERIELPEKDDEDDDEYLKYATPEIRAELKAAKKSGYVNGIGRGRINSKNSSQLLQKQLRTVNSTPMSNNLIEEYVNQRAEALKNESPKLSAACAKKRPTTQTSSVSSSPSKEYNNCDRQVSSSNRGSGPKKTCDEVKPDSFKTPGPVRTFENKRRSKNALIESLLQQIKDNDEKNEEEEEEEVVFLGSVSPYEVNQCRRNSKVSSSMLTDDDVVVGSEILMDDEHKNEEFYDDSRFNFNPKAFSELAKETESEVQEFKNEFLKNFVAADCNLEAKHIGKNSVAGLEAKKRKPKNQTLVFTNSSRINHNNSNRSSEKKYEKLAQKVFHQNRQGKPDAGFYDITPHPFFSTSRKPADEQPKNYSQSGNSDNFNVFDSNFPSLR